MILESSGADQGDDQGDRRREFSHGHIEGHSMDHMHRGRRYWSESATNPATILILGFPGYPSKRRGLLPSPAASMLIRPVISSAITWRESRRRSRGRGFSRLLDLAVCMLELLSRTPFRLSSRCGLAAAAATTRSRCPMMTITTKISYLKRETYVRMGFQHSNARFCVCVCVSIVVYDYLVRSVLVLGGCFGNRAREIRAMHRHGGDTKIGGRAREA